MKQGAQEEGPKCTIISQIIIVNANKAIWRGVKKVLTNFSLGLYLMILLVKLSFEVLLE